MSGCLYVEYTHAGQRKHGAEQATPDKANRHTRIVLETTFFLSALIKRLIYCTCAVFTCSWTTRSADFTSSPP